jgi:hypothetical protein
MHTLDTARHVQHPLTLYLGVDDAEQAHIALERNDFDRENLDGRVGQQRWS